MSKSASSNNQINEFCYDFSKVVPRFYQEVIWSWMISKNDRWSTCSGNFPAQTWIHIHQFQQVFTTQQQKMRVCRICLNSATDCLISIQSTMDGGRISDKMLFIGIKVRSLINFIETEKNLNKNFSLSSLPPIRFRNSFAISARPRSSSQRPSKRSLLRLRKSWTKCWQWTSIL